MKTASNIIYALAMIGLVGAVASLNIHILVFSQNLVIVYTILQMFLADRKIRKLQNQLCDNNKTVTQLGDNTESES
ncbi:MAG: hypothetical protein ACRDBG_16680 [Waterburya sp.]